MTRKNTVELISAVWWSLLCAIGTSALCTIPYLFSVGIYSIVGSSIAADTSTVIEPTTQGGFEIRGNAAPFWNRFGDNFLASWWICLIPGLLVFVCIWLSPLFTAQGIIRRSLNRWSARHDIRSYFKSNHPELLKDPRFLEATKLSRTRGDISTGISLRLGNQEREEIVVIPGALALRLQGRLRPFDVKVFTWGGLDKEEILSTLAELKQATIPGIDSPSKRSAS